MKLIKQMKLSEYSITYNINMYANITIDLTVNITTNRLKNLIKNTKYITQIRANKATFYAETKCL